MYAFDLPLFVYSIGMQKYHESEGGGKIVGCWMQRRVRRYRRRWWYLVFVVDVCFFSNNDLKVISATLFEL